MILVFFAMYLLPLWPEEKIINAAEQMEPIPMVEIGHFDTLIMSINPNESFNEPPVELIY